MEENKITDPFCEPVRLIHSEGSNFIFRWRKDKILGKIPNLIVLQKGNILFDGHGYEHIKACPLLTQQLLIFTTGNCAEYLQL